MDDPDPTAEVADAWRRFARVQARGRSPVYEEIAERVAGDADVLAMLAPCSPRQRQPNLLLAAVQYLEGPVTGWAGFRQVVEVRSDELLRVMATRATQTNVPARCATLLPALADLPGPLALLEVGAAAGLCLLPDRYGYRYTVDGGSTVGLPPARPHPARRSCRAR